MGDLGWASGKASYQHRDAMLETAIQRGQRCSIPTTLEDLARKKAAWQLDISYSVHSVSGYSSSGSPLVQFL